MIWSSDLYAVISQECSRAVTNHALHTCVNKCLYLAILLNLLHSQLRLCTQCAILNLFFLL